jgi:hypothetical protein
MPARSQFNAIAQEALHQTSRGHSPGSAHHTYTATFNIYGATDHHAVARQVKRAFSDFVQGARSQRRLAG